jgi:hypothetical protein
MANKEVLDPHGYPIEMDRPVVFDEGKLDPHTELSITESASDLGLPGEGFYNVPSIYEGKIYNPQDPAHYETIKNYAQKQAAQGFRFPNFPSVEEAETAAKARSEYFNQVKAEMLREAVEKRRQELMLQMIKGAR